MKKYQVYYKTNLDLIHKLSTTGEGTKRYTFNKVTFRYFPQKVLTFVKNCKCIACGIEGTEVRIERSYCNDPIYGKPHLNVYAVCGLYEVLMTVDHNQLASKGGDDLESNFNTMCILCNQMRSNKTETVQEFLENVKGRNLIDEHMKSFFDKVEKKNNPSARKPESIAYEKWWNEDHLWHYRDYLRKLKKEEKALLKQEQYV